MFPQTQPRKTRNSSKVNLLISLAFHALIIITAFYFAARQGLLGKQMRKIAVQMVKEKPPEKPKEPEKPKPEPPKVEPPRAHPRPEPPKIVEAPKPSAPLPAAPPTVAPPPAEMPAFEFAGGKTVESADGPVGVYRGLLEYAFRAKWDKPEDIQDDGYVAEVQVSVNPDGRIGDPQWLKTSGNPRWDASVRRAVAAITNLDHPPPTNFPSHVVIRFDVQEQTESAFQ